MVLKLHCGLCQQADPPLLSSPLLIIMACLGVLIAMVTSWLSRMAMVEYSTGRMGLGLIDSLGSKEVF